MKSIKISYKWLNKKFKCDTDIIKNTCKGRCCSGSNKLLVSLLPEEIEDLQKHFDKCVIKNNKIETGTKLCFFKDEYGFCTLHNTIHKPLGCIFSPFKINKSNTLILRHRYIRFPCFNVDDGKPAYITFSASLIKVFGIGGYAIIKQKMEKNNGDFYIDIEDKMLEKLNYLEDIKYG